MKKLKEIFKFLLLLILIITVLILTTENIYLLENFPGDNNDNNNVGKIITLLIIIISTCFFMQSKAMDKATNIRYTEIQKVYPREEKPYTKEELDDLLARNVDDSGKKIPIDLTLDREIFEGMVMRFTVFLTIFMVFYYILYTYDMLGFKNSIDNFILKKKIQYPRIFKSRFFLIVFTYWCLLIIIQKYLW